MDLLKSMQVAASGLRAQSGRMKVIAENIANAESTSSVKGGDPYQRRIPTFREVFDAEVGQMWCSRGGSSWIAPILVKNLIPAIPLPMTRASS